MRRMGEGCRLFSLIEDGDRILVGVSGGKDSLTLLEMLARRQRIRVPAFRVEAVHVSVTDVGYGSDNGYLQEFASRLGVPMHFVTTPLPVRSSNSGVSRKPICFLCSWARRKAMFQLAMQLGCNKLALGHHQDDILLTALMNLTFQGQFATMPAVLRMRRMPLTVIRPLCCVPECDIREWAAEARYLPPSRRCPHECLTNRTHIVSVMDAMEHLSADARRSLWRALVSAGKLQEGGEQDDNLGC